MGFAARRMPPVGPCVCCVFRGASRSGSLAPAYSVPVVDGMRVAHAPPVHRSLPLTSPSVELLSASTGRVARNSLQSVVTEQARRRVARRRVRPADNVRGSSIPCPCKQARRRRQAPARRGQGLSRGAYRRFAHRPHGCHGRGRIKEDRFESGRAADGLGGRIHLRRARYRDVVAPGCASAWPTAHRALPGAARASSTRS